MRAVLRRSFFVVAMLAGCTGLAAGSALFACAGDDPGGGSTTDAGGEGSLLGDTDVPQPDADAPLGDVCGVAAGVEKDAPWPLRGGCPKRAGVSTNAGPSVAAVKWSLPMAAGDSSPAIGADRLIWVGTTDGDVIVLSANGIVQSALHTGGAVRSSPARSPGGLTVIGSSDGNLYGVERGAAPADAGADADAGDPDAGDEAGSSVTPARAIYKHSLAPIVSSPVIGGDGTVFVSAKDGNLYAVSADGSATRWTAKTGDTTGTSSPALAADGTIYIGSADAKLYAVTATGMIKWTVATGGPILGSPVVGGDETIYVGSSDGKLLAVSPDGKTKWTYPTGASIGGAPCVRGGVVYVGSDDKKLHAVSTTDGKKKWTYDTLGAVATPVTGADGVVYVGSADGNLYAILPSGLLFFAVKTKGKIHSAPALSDDETLYVTTDTALVAIGQ